MILITADPEGEVNCDVPMIAASSQNGAVASQNVTTPEVTGAPFETAAVSVTTVPEVTEAEERVTVVVVGPAARARSTNSSPRIARAMTRTSPTYRFRSAEKNLLNCPERSNSNSESLFMAEKISFHAVGN